MKSSSDPATPLPTHLEAWNPISFEASVLVQEQPEPEVTTAFADFLAPQLDVQPEETKEKPASPDRLKGWEPEALAQFEYELAAVVNRSVPVNIAQATDSQIQKAKDAAAEIVADATHQAERIVQQAREEADRLRSQMVSEAHQQGLQIAQQETTARLQAAKTMAEQVTGWAEQVFQLSEPIVVDLIREMARQMFGEGIELDRERLHTIFAGILSRARTLGELRVYMNPADEAVLGQEWKEMQAMLLGNPIQIYASEEVQRGGCFVEGQVGSVDGLVSHQLQALLHAFDHRPETGAGA